MLDDRIHRQQLDGDAAVRHFAHTLGPGLLKLEIRISRRIAGLELQIEIRGCRRARQKHGANGE